MTGKELPILEFDEDRAAFIRPESMLESIDVSQKCVLCFSSEAIEKILKEYPHKIVSHFATESLMLPLYELEYKGKKVALMQAGVGAPIAGAQGNRS